jgi:cysteinyl-tRNA synthetase
MEQAEEAIRRMVDFRARLDAVRGDGSDPEVAARVAKAREGFNGALESDLNTAAALAAVFDFVREVNAAIDAGRVSGSDATAVARALDDFDRVLGVMALRRAEDAEPPVPAEEIERLIGERRAARTRKDFAAADRIRTELADRGILLEDGAGGTRWKRK